MIVNSQYNTVQNGSLGAIKIYIAPANKLTSLSNLTPSSNALQGSYNKQVFRHEREPRASFPQSRRQSKEQGALLMYPRLHTDIHTRPSQTPAHVPQHPEARSRAAIQAALHTQSLTSGRLNHAPRAQAACHIPSRPPVFFRALPHALASSRPPASFRALPHQRGLGRNYNTRDRPFITNTPTPLAPGQSNALNLNRRRHPSTLTRHFASSLAR